MNRSFGNTVEPPNRKEIEKSDRDARGPTDGEKRIQWSVGAVVPENYPDDHRRGEQELTENPAPSDLRVVETCFRLIETAKAVMRIDLDGKHPVTETMGDELMAELVNDENEEI